MNRRIGVTCGRIWEGDAFTYQIREKYFTNILSAGGLPILQTGEAGVETLDGILFTGGGDCTPAWGRYGADVPEEKLRCTDPWRDETEARILEKAMERGVRILGICRGMQAVNAFLGGGLHYDIADCLGTLPETHENGAEHPVRIRRDSRLFRLLGKEELPVNSYHHQAVSRIAGILETAAVSGGGVAEGLEGENILLVQWHPERMPEMQPLFRWLCGADG